MTFYRNQKELAHALKELIDSYWREETDEEVLFKQVQEIVERNKDKVYSEGVYGSVLEQRLGKKRLFVITRILEEVNSKKEVAN